MKFFRVSDNKIIEKAKKLNLDIDEISPVMPSVKNGGLLGDCGIDFFAAYDFSVEPHSLYVADTFYGLKIAPGVCVLLFPRSGDKHLLGAGVIDTGYSGSIMFKIFNPLNETMYFKQGDSVGQAVPIAKSEPSGIILEEVDSGWEESARKDTGRITKEYNL